jgi:PAS domain S-box-containing protein
METYDKELTRIKSLLKGSAKGLTVTEISHNIGINRNSVAKYLDVLRTSGIVELKLVGSAKVFSLTKRIPVSSILSLSSDYIFVLDDDYVVTYVNENVLNFEQKTNDEIIGKPVNIVNINLLSFPDINTILHECITGKDISKELEIQKDEKIFYFRAKFVPSLLENGKKGFMIILDDITEIRQYQQELEKTVADQDEELTTSYRSLKKEIKNHKEVKEAFEESERKYRNLIELAQEGVWTCDPEGLTTFVNKKLTEILGYSEEELLEKPIFSFCHEADQVAFKEYFKDLTAGNAGYYQLKFLKKDGSIAYVQLSASPSIDDSGSFVYGLFVVSDISDLKKADDALRESELYYRTLIETSPNGIVMFDLNGEVRMANIQAAKMLGYSTTKDLIFKNLFDYIAPNDLEKWQVNLKRATINGYIKNLECTLISKDNAGFCVDMSISTLRGVSNLPTGYVGIISDITERRKSDYLVRKSEEKHRSLVEGISHIIFTTDIKGKYTYVSPVIQKVLGYKPEELIGKHFYMLVPSDERHKLGLKLKEAQSGKSGPNDFKMMDKSGEIHWVRISAQPIKEGDSITGITGLIGDINDWKRTEDALHKSELQYKAVVEDQIDLICRFLPDLTITFVNPAYCRYYHKGEEELLNQSFISLFPEKMHEKVIKIVSGLFSDNPVQTLEHELVAPEGDTRWHHLTIRGIFNQNGVPIEYQSSSRDLTELKLYFERSHTLLGELQKHQVELEKQNEELKQLRQAAERSEKKYLDLYDFAPVGYFTLGSGGEILEVNQTGSNLIGKPRHELIHTPFKDYISEEYCQEFTQFCERISETTNKQTCEAVLLRNKNTPLNIQIEGRAIENQGYETKQCRIVIIDISDRKKSEKALKESEGQLKAIIHGSPNPQFVIDKNHRVIYWNKAMSAITGIEANDVIGSSNHFKAFYPDEGHCMADLLIDGTTEEIAKWYPDTTSKSEIAEDAYETIGYFPNLGKTGKWLRITAAAIRDSNTTILGALETIEDITDLKFAEESVKSANKKLNTLNTVTRHDILNQMMVWSGYMDLIEEQLPDNPTIKEQINRAKTAAAKVQRLIIFTRDYQNLGVEMAKWQSLEQVIEKALRAAHPKDISTQVLTGPVQIFSDPLIEKVMFNLIDNTIQHGEHATKIKISLREENGLAIIVYEDDGEGIPVSMKEKVFGKGVGKNSGFGLYLSKEILNYSGIDIQETGEEHKGARFEIIVPRGLFKISV